METLTCVINPFWEKQLIRNDYTKKELQVKLENLPEALHFLYLEKQDSIKEIWFEGPYMECDLITYRYKNKYPNDDISFKIA